MIQHPGVWCCEHKEQCRFQGLRLSLGLGWGKVPEPPDAFLRLHERYCGGRLIQLVQPSAQEDEEPTQ